MYYDVIRRFMTAPHDSMKPWRLTCTPAMAGVSHLNLIWTYISLFSLLLCLFSVKMTVFFVFSLLPEYSFIRNSATAHQSGHRRRG
jgi:hypothetical protein